LRKPGRHAAPPRRLRTLLLLVLATALGAVTLTGVFLATPDRASEAGADDRVTALGTAPTSAPEPSEGAPGRHRAVFPQASDEDRPDHADAPNTGDWPGPETTGVPAGVALTSSGSLTIQENGAVISGLEINGCVDVQASDVTIRQSRIRCDRPHSAVRLHSGHTGLLLEDVEIDGSGITDMAICCGHYTLRRANIHNTVDGPRLGSGTVVEDSWIHHLARIPGSHNDALQTTGGVDIVVRRNRIEPYNPDTGDPFNAAIMIGSETAPEVRNLLFEDNYCNGGNYTIGVREDLNGSNIVFRGNTFGRDHRYGVIARPTQRGITWDDASNVYADTGEPVTGS
jgi:hypothetical protein